MVKHVLLWLSPVIIIPIVVFACIVYFASNRETEDVTYDIFGREITSIEIGLVKTKNALAQRQFPLISLRGKLSYEIVRNSSGPNSLSQDSQQILELMEDQILNRDRGRWGRLRTESLRMLHEESVEAFVESEGFGVSRITPAGFDYLRYRDREPIAITQIDKQSLDENCDSTNRSVLSFGQVRGFHLSAIANFLNPIDFGYVRDIDHVAGFQSHGFSGRVSVGGQAHWKPGEDFEKRLQDNHLTPTNPINHWQLEGLELVSLLKHDPPVAYVTGYLPQMDMIESAQTRPLSKFEADSCRQLAQGESLITHSTPLRIQMVGAIRASRQCMQCHQVQRGTLLGAFTYVLTRGIKVESIKQR